MKVQVIGLEKLAQSFARYTKTKTEELRDETKKAAINVERGTKRRLASQADDALGRLTSSYHSRHSGKEISSDVHSNLFYAPFVEFGTGTLVFESPHYDFTDEEKKYAEQFRRGPGKNMPANPALFPSWEEERVKYIERVKKALGRL